MPPGADAASLAAELEHTKRVLATKLTDLRTFQTERETLIARIAERDARIQRLEQGEGADVPRLRTQVLDLESELSIARSEASRATHLDAELAALRAQGRRIEAAVAERGARVEELETAASQRDQRVGELEADLSQRDTRITELEAALEQERAKLVEREARVRTLETEVAESLEWAPAPADDLTRIKGIGPKFRDALAAAGIKSYAQVAAWREPEIAEVAAKLRIQRSRILREGWVEAAQALAAQGQRLG